jgi:hypothetical protein
LEKIYLKDAEEILLQLRGMLNAASSSYNIYEVLKSKELKNDQVFKSLERFFKSTVAAHFNYCVLQLAKFFDTSPDVVSICSIKSIDHKITKRKYNPDETRLIEQLRNIRDSYVAHELKRKKESDLTNGDLAKILEIAEKDMNHFYSKLILQFSELDHMRSSLFAKINAGGEAEALFDIIADYEKSDRAKEIAENIKQENEKLRIKYSKKFTGKRMIIQKLPANFKNL